MRYKIKCNKCGKDFQVDTEEEGIVKVECPYCHNVLNCQLGAPKPFRTRARSIVPIVDGTEIDANTIAHQPVAKTKFLKMATAEMLLSAKESITAHAHQATELAATTTAATSEFVSHSSSKIKAFQEKYKDGDLWVFFIGSISYILLVFIVLFLMAQLTNDIYDGHQWLFKNYIELKNSIGF